MRIIDHNSSSRRFRHVFLVAFLAVLLCSAASAQNTSERQRRSIQTTGESVVTATPDRARIDIGVVTQSASSQDAAAQNAKKTSDVIGRLRSLLGQAADIKTISYALSPNYTYPREGGEARLTGYSASNTIRVTLDDLTKVGSVIDTATQAGANRIQQLQFILKDERPVLDQALREATSNAKRKAESIASAAGVRVLRVISVVESGRVAVPYENAFVVRAEAAQTPIEPGTIEIRATVTLKVEIE